MKEICCAHTGTRICVCGFGFDEFCIARTYYLIIIHCTIYIDIYYIHLYKAGACSIAYILVSCEAKLHMIYIYTNHIVDFISIRVWHKNVKWRKPTEVNFAHTFFRNGSSVFKFICNNFLFHATILYIDYFLC